jgi:hypothetical protein
LELRITDYPDALVVGTMTTHVCMAAVCAPDSL